LALFSRQGLAFLLRVSCCLLTVAPMASGNRGTCYHAWLLCSDGISLTLCQDWFQTTSFKEMEENFSNLFLLSNWGYRCQSPCLAKMIILDSRSIWLWSSNGDCSSSSLHPLLGPFAVWLYCCFL
jgi:hypothetical protein